MIYKTAAILYRAVKAGEKAIKVFDPATINQRHLKVKGLYLAPTEEVAHRWGDTLFQDGKYEVHKVHVPDDVEAIGARDGFYVHPGYKQMMKLKVDSVKGLMQDKQLATGMKRVTSRRGLNGPKYPMEMESLPEIVIKEKDLHKVKHLGKV